MKRSCSQANTKNSSDKREKTGVNITMSLPTIVKIAWKAVSTRLLKDLTTDAIN
jgi:hypothetical protein